LQVHMVWRCKMADNWIKLWNVQFPDKCLDCKKMIHRGETAFWLPTMQYLLHPGCGLGSKPTSYTIHPKNAASDKDPFENSHEHTPTYYAAKEWRDSRD